MRACCSASSNLFLLDASHAFSYSILAFEGTFNLVTLTVVDRTASNFHGKHVSSSAVGLVLNGALRTTFTDGSPCAPKVGVYLVFCARKDRTETTIAKAQSGTRFQLKAADRLERSGFSRQVFRRRVITLEQGLPVDLRVAFISRMLALFYTESR